MKTNQIAVLPVERKGPCSIILVACPYLALASGMYTWRHNNVLTVVAEVVEQRVNCVDVDQTPSSTKQFISFVKEG